MADMSDVEEALLRLAAGVVYPQGPQAPSLVGRACRLYRGWPQGAALDADLAAGRVHVTVVPEARPQAVTTRHPDRWETMDTPAPGLVSMSPGAAPPCRAARIRAKWPG